MPSSSNRKRRGFAQVMARLRVVTQSRTQEVKQAMWRGTGGQELLDVLPLKGRLICDSKAASAWNRRTDYDALQVGSQMAHDVRILFKYEHGGKWCLLEREGLHQKELITRVPTKHGHPLRIEQPVGSNGITGRMGQKLRRMPGRGQACRVCGQRVVSRGERQPATLRGDCYHVAHAKARRQKALVERAIGRRKKAKVDARAALQLLSCNQIR